MSERQREREASDNRSRALWDKERERRETTGYEPFEARVSERERGRESRATPDCEPV